MCLNPPPPNPFPNNAQISVAAEGPGKAKGYEFGSESRRAFILVLYEFRDFEAGVWGLRVGAYKGSRFRV